jgi:capsular exopolysaccharide synthesis family protein
MTAAGLRVPISEPILSERPAVAEELVSFAAPASSYAEQYRILRQEVERLARDTGARVFAITSAAAGEGKTVTALNLAGALAQGRTSNVLVVEADLHRPAMLKYLGVTGTAPGLADAIVKDQLDLVRTVRRFERFGISVIPAGTVKNAPYELLSSSRFAALLAEMRRLYDYVLLDTPPILPVADCRLLGSLVDGFIVVVAAHKTPRSALLEAVSTLAPAKVFGLVLNGDERSRGSSYAYEAYANDATAPSQARDRGRQ